jgi:hypothetical protein
MAERKIMIGVANEGEMSIDVELVKTWEPKSITYFSDIVYFKVDNAFYSMKRKDFTEIFYK